MSELNFTNSYYKNIALCSNSVTESKHSSAQAIMLLIHGLDKEELYNLCLMMQRYYKNLTEPYKLTIDECYNLTQSNTLDESTMQIIEKMAFTCVEEGINLGIKTTADGKINTSSWISHSINVSKVCACLANKLKLDINTAKILGLMHDYGRKYNHSFSHIIHGFEKLIDLGWNNEAIGCLTHSFVNNGRCANNDVAVTGFYVDDLGNPKWVENAKKDDITIFLENYKYTNYDIILNIADLMATSKTVVSPYERVSDIATRRILDPTNRGYFLAETINILTDVLLKTKFCSENINKIKANKYLSIEQIESIFKETSNIFFIAYQEMQNEYEKKYRNKQVL